MEEKAVKNKKTKVKWVEMDSEKAKKFVESFIKRAGKRFEEAKKYLEGYFPSYPESISASQECIEFSLKAIFLMLLNKYPKEHWISKHELQEVMERISEISKNKKSELLQWRINIEDFPKLYLYSEFWQKFYTVAKYGDEELGIPAEKLFGKEEADLALKHAEKCRNLASAIQNYLKYGPK
jgi:HEPN domain-containing protein